MTEVPKIVYDRLQGLLRTAQAHPDADLLAAFAERALSSDERDGILEHLALCGDCRDVVTLGLPAEAVSAPIEIETETDQPLVIPAKAKNGWLIWPGLRWAALATGVAVAASVLLLHPGKLNQAMQPSAKQPAATIAEPTGHSQIAASTGGILAKAVPDKATTGETQPESSELPKKRNKSLDVSKLRRGEPPTVRVTGARANDSTGETISTSPDSTLVAQNNAPAIEKAKQVPPAIQAQVSTQQPASGAAAASEPPRNQMAAAEMSARVAWSITGGTLQRSVDGGQSWQSALHADRALLCYAVHEEDVWAGGQAGVLFHSSNGGLTWMQIQPSINSQQLNSDITHLELRDTSQTGEPRFPREIMVSTSNNEIWRSIDGGTTWDRK